MRSVIFHLRDASEEEVAQFLQRAFPFQAGPPWICDVEGDPCLYIDLYRDGPNEYEPKDWARLVDALGCAPATSVVADVSGRHAGDDQLRFLASKLLGEFQGLAMDDFSEHYWSAAEVLSGVRADGDRFFDYRKEVAG
jgi:hypothetical protein